MKVAMSPRMYGEVMGHLPVALMDKIMAEHVSADGMVLTGTIELVGMKGQLVVSKATPDDTVVVTMSVGELRHLLR